MQRRNFIFASALVPLFKTVLAQDILVQQIPVRPIKPATFYWLDAPGLTIFWSETFLQVVRSSEFDSPMVARSMAIVHTAMYNAWACFDDQLTATLDIADIKQLTATHNLQNQLVAMSYAAYTTLLAQFPTQENHIHKVMQELHFPVKAKNAPAIYAKAAWVGERIAQMVLIERLNDASNQDGGLSNSHLAFDNYQSYESKNPVLDYSDANPIDAVLPDIWQPISYINAQGTQVTPAFLVSHWHLVTPFALSSANQFRPPAPAVWGNDAFKTQAEQLLKIQTHLTDEQKGEILGSEGKNFIQPRISNIYIDSVTPKSEAAKAELLKGDVIQSVNGKQFSYFDVFAEDLKKLKNILKFIILIKV